MDSIAHEKYAYNNKKHLSTKFRCAIIIFFMTKEENESLCTNLLSLINDETGIHPNVYPSNINEILHTQDSERSPFSSLLELFVHLEFTEEEAVNHWKSIIENGKILKTKLERNIGIHLAIVDYFTNINRMMNAPILIEIHVFKQTEKLAMIDGLTGLFNRRYMDIVLKKEFNRCERYTKNMSVCLLDIDNFKHINDSRGHSFGDLVLKELAVMLKDTVREEDFVCRYGGEEFLIILPETDEAGVQNYAERLRLEEKKRPFFVDNKITFSGGMATFPNAARAVTDLVDAADRALYKAKFAGKDQILKADTERRKFGRYIHSWSLDIFQKKSPRPITGILTQNVSRGGIQFECPVPYSVDTSLDLVFANIDKTVPNIEAKGRITWIKKIPESYVYGVSFVDTDAILNLDLSSQLPGITDLVKE